MITLEAFGLQDLFCTAGGLGSKAAGDPKQLICRYENIIFNSILYFQYVFWCFVINELKNGLNSFQSLH